MLGKNCSRRHFEIIFLFSPEKKALAFHANCHLGDNLLKLSKSIPIFLGVCVCVCGGGGGVGAGGGVIYLPKSI